MEQKSTRPTRSRKRGAPDRAVGTPAEAQGAAGGDASAAGLQAMGPSGGIAAAEAAQAGIPGGAADAGARSVPPSMLASEPTADDELAGAEPLLVAERITIVGEMPLDDAAQPDAAERRYLMIRERAYVYASERGFEPGGELEDWLRAEREIDAQMGTHPGGSDAGT